MTVKELIAQLQQQNPDATVELRIYVANAGWWEDTTADEVFSSEDGKIVVIT